ncbi:MAG: hypothetical protein CH6_3001 [Candidatus Kapaibacterium sp.]|nr:MAG: hypothetical protein CH6_3001 [Candidatus Kapabacteria bacterium]
MKAKNVVWFTLIIMALIGTSCRSPKPISENFSFYSDVYTLYTKANEFDTNTKKYIKNKYLVDLLVNASKNEQLGLYHQAIVDLLDALRFDTSKVILFGLARNFYFIEKYTLAFDYGIRSYLLDSNFIPTIELLAWTLLERNQFKEAIFFSNRLIKLKGRNLTQNDLKLHLNILDRLDNTYKSSIDFLTSIQEPKFEDFINSQLIYYYFLNNDTNNIINVVEKIFSNKEKIQDERYILLDLYIRNLINKGEYQKALQKFEELSERTSSENNLKLCDIFIQNLKRIDSTNPGFIKEFDGLINRKYQNDFRFHFKLLQMYFILDDTSKVYSISNKILSNDNIDLETLINVSYILYYNLKLKNEAIQKFQSFKFKFLDEPIFYNVLGEFYVNNKEYALAENAFLKSLQLDSNNYQTYSNLAWLYSETEEWDKSDSLYMRSLELFPDNPITLNNFAYSLIQRGKNLNYAGKLIEKAIKLRPDDPNLLDTYGWYFYKINDFEKAKEYIEKSISLDSSRAEPFLHLSLILRKLGREEEANYNFEKAISIDPNNKEILQELERQKK